MTLLGIPLKGFGIGKSRLGGVLDDDTRSRLGRFLAEHTLSVATVVGVRICVVTADAEVAAMAAAHGVDVAVDPGGGLDAAAEVVVATAGGAPWMVLHADLPRLTAGDLEAALTALEHGPVLAPSFDGGTPLIGGREPVRFAYGPGSFHRHLQRMSTATVIVRPGLALDLDTADDLRLVQRWGATSAAKSSRPDVSWAVSGK